MNTFLKKGERRLFVLVICITIVFLMYPTYLPLVDLPQHAAQVTSLDSILKQQYLWGGFTELNWDTPYLTGYLSWLLLYQIFDIKTSAKVFIVCIFLLYCLSIHLLRKYFKAPALLEWAALTSFFGFAYQWGFVTFLLAIPIGIFFFLVNMKWVAKPQIGTWLAIIVFGSLLYVSHVLIFAFFCFLTYGYYLVTHVLKENEGEFSFALPPIKSWLIYSIPYWLFAYLLYRYVNKPDPFTEANASFDIYVFQPLGQKTLELLYMPWNMLGDNGLYTVVAILMLIAPVLMGYKPSKEINKYILLFGFFIIWYALPDNAFHTSMIYQRFSMFFVLFYFIFWEKKKHESGIQRALQKIGCGIFILSIGFWMVNLFNNNVQFEQVSDTKAFNQLLPQMEPQKRVLTMFDPDLRSSGKLSSNMEYIYLGNWYQAEKKGWVDFNFAWFLPQIVRFQLGSTPEKLSMGPWVSEPVISGLQYCNQYDYLLMKTNVPPEKILLWLHNNPSCRQMHFKTNANNWILFENYK